MRNGSPVGAIIAIAFGLLLFLAWKVSSSIGSNYNLTLEAIISSAGLLFATAFVGWYFSPRASTLSLVSAAAIWPQWWDVIDSIAAGGRRPDEVFLVAQMMPWWTSGWLKWGIEAGLIVTLLYLWSKNDNRYRW